MYRKPIIIIFYILSAIWGLFILYGLIINPYDMTGVPDFAVIFTTISLSTIMLGPFGIVYAIDRHFKNRDKRNEILKR